MPYSTATLSKVTAGIGSGGVNVWSYSTADALATVVGAGYVSDAVAKGVKLGDVVLVVISNILKPCSVTTLGAATATLTVAAIT